MKKIILFGLTSVVFAALLMLNISIVSEVASTSLALQKTCLVANAEEGDDAKWAWKNTLQGTIEETCTIEGRLYKRTCYFTEVTCGGTGTITCVPSLVTGNCSAWVAS